MTFLTIQHGVPLRDRQNFRSNKSAWFGERYFVADNAFADSSIVSCLSVHDSLGNIHGICSYDRIMHSANYRIVYVKNIATSGVYRGVGKALMSEIFKIASIYREEVWLHSSEGAVGFYEHIGMLSIPPNCYYCPPHLLKDLIQKIEQELYTIDNVFEAVLSDPAYANAY